jgi:hypothetical protein
VGAWQAARGVDIERGQDGVKRVSLLKIQFFQKLKFSTLHYHMKMTLDDLEIFLSSTTRGTLLISPKLKFWQNFSRSRWPWMTLKKYAQESFLTTIYYYEGYMLVSQTVDFIKILEILHRLIMGGKIWTHLSQIPKRLLKIWTHPMIEGVKGYNRLNHTIEVPP